MAVQEDEALAERVFAVLTRLSGAQAPTPIDAACRLSSIGFDSIACAELAAVMERELGIPRREALALASVSVDLRVTQIVNGAKGVHAILRA